MRKHIGKYCVALLLGIAVLFLSSCGETQKTTETISTVVSSIEKYGHTVLDITAADFADAGYAYGDVVCVRLGSHTLEMPYFDGYYSNPGELMLRGRDPEKPIALCINYDNFAEVYGTSVGDPVEITLVKEAAMLMVQEICKLQYTCDRADYADDAVFANFRAVTTGTIGEGKLFRSASPVNNAYGRAAYANDLAESAGIVSALNLSDSVETIEECMAADDFDSAYYRSLYAAGKVLALDQDADFRSPEYAAGIADGFIFLSENEPPFLLHCKEGKDRTGFACMLLEALMGASLDEIIDDYMVSFYNYFGITEEKEPERYRTVLEINLPSMLYHVFGVTDMETLAQVDLEAGVIEYLQTAGMTREEIAVLQEKLR